MIRTICIAVLLAIGLTVGVFGKASAEQVPMAETDLDSLAKSLKVGDVVFIRVPFKLFTKVADATQSWTNHVGIVVDVSGPEPLIAESTVPLSRITTLSKFVKRSDNGRVEVSRLNAEPDANEQAAIVAAAHERLGVLYDTGFDLRSSRQFCSRYVFEVVKQGTGVEIGQVQTFSEMLKDNQNAELGFWRAWYFGRIPWERETVTPASVLRSRKMHGVFDGRVVTS